MADSEPTTSSSVGQAAETRPKEPLDQPLDAVELHKLGSGTPATKHEDDVSQPATSTAPILDDRHDSDPATSKTNKGKSIDTGAATPSASFGGDAITPAAESSTAAAAAAATSASTADEPTCTITLLLTTGDRHAFRLDNKYLTKRNVEVIDLDENGKKDPFSISIYKFKELILREWRDEWTDRPASPSSIRLISFGKMLDDKEPLKKYQFTADSPNVVHMSVRPQEMLEEEEGAKNPSGGSTSGRVREGRRCCVIQ